MSKKKAKMTQDEINLFISVLKKYLEEADLKPAQLSISMGYSRSNVSNIIYENNVSTQFVSHFQLYIGKDEYDRIEQSVLSEQQKSKAIEQTQLIPDELGLFQEKVIAKLDDIMAIVLTTNGKICEQSERPASANEFGMSEQDIKCIEVMAKRMDITTEEFVVRSAYNFYGFMRKFVNSGKDWSLPQIGSLTDFTEIRREV